MFIKLINDFLIHFYILYNFLYISIYFNIYYIFLYTLCQTKEMQNPMDHPCYSRSENFSSRVSNRDLLNRDLAVVIPEFTRKRRGR